MSVYTPLTLQQVQAFAAQYNLDVQGITPIQAGIENTNYFVQLSSGQELVLTLFEDLSREQALILPPVLHHLAEDHIAVAVPLVSTQGDVILTLENKPAQLAPRLIGENPLLPTLQQASQMGQTLANIHWSLQSYPLQLKNYYDQQWWLNAVAETRTDMSAVDQSIADQLLAVFEQAQQQYPERPQGLIHSDLFRDNTLYSGDMLTGVLDFSKLCLDEWLLDVAITLNDFCSQWPSVQLDHDKVQAFLQAYHQVRPLTTDEQHALPAYLSMAAGRFWMSRLLVAVRNQSEGRTGEHVLQKDPNEMKAMVQDRLLQVSQVKYAL
jgi:homoserine kinase type II